MRGTRVGAAALVTVVLFSGCPHRKAAISRQPHPSTTVHACVSGPGPPPPSGLSWSIQGHPDRSVPIPVGPDGMLLHVAFRQDSTTTITSAEFLVAPEPNADNRLRHLPVPPIWKPGAVTVPVTWDRRDDEGHVLAPGLYRLSVDVIVDQRLSVTCADGTGHGVEVHQGTYEGGEVVDLELT